MAYETNRAAVRSILAAIDAVRLADLTPADVRAVACHLRAAGRWSSTALRYHDTLMRTLRAASLDSYAIPPNVPLAEKPTRAVHDRQPLPLDDTVRVLQHVASQPGGSR